MSNTLELFSGSFMQLFVVNILFLLVLLRGIFYRYSPNRDSLFGFFMFGNGVFLVTHLLQAIEISMGFAFGLFAIFAMLRYRTESIPIRDMSYLFLVIVISLITGVGPLSAPSLMLVNGLLCGLVAIGETHFFAPKVYKKNIRYENIQNIKPERYDELMADLKERTGMDIVHIEVASIDFLNDAANLKVSYNPVHRVDDSIPTANNVDALLSKSESNG